MQRQANDAYRLEKNICPLWPEKFRYEKNVNQDELLIFKATAPADFDWLEEQIFKHGYYEKLGIWSFQIDDDKRTLAEMVASFTPRKTLDFGCANGPLLQAIADLKIHAEGVEISSFAIKNAFPAIRERIHHGDISSVALESGAYDVVTGLDIFEHLNPNKIDRALESIHRVLAPGGHIFANIPAFGPDRVFGQVFEYYMPDWDQQRDGSSYFKSLHCDMHGYPVNGHLIWADTIWWEKVFRDHGFTRDVEREKQLHERYNRVLSPARKSFYVFKKS
ncbi:MAG: class I SAM-dependent methyltransferase [Myxococcaceae bacterium]